MEIYQNKQQAYFNQERHDLISLVSQNAQNKVLEIGAAGGSTLAYLKQNKLAQEVVGVELFEIENAFQTSQLIDRFIIANIESENLDLPKDYFDIIICGDVLEHLIDPWKTLNYLKQFLKNGGIFIISIPNIREFKTMMKIFGLGDFRYAESGILDKTHLRFFCKKNIIDLVQSVDLKINYICPSFERHKALKREKRINQFTLGLFKDFLAQQYLVVAQK